LGTEKNPVKLFFVPSVDAKVIEDKSKDIKKFLEANTPYKFKVGIPTSYVAVVESFGTERADVASLNTFGYIMANEKYGVEAKMTVIRYGQSTYKAQIIARKDSGINSIKDIDGKKFAFVDPASTSGYLLPMKLLKENKVKPSQETFAYKHDNVVSMVYQGQVDAGATFYSPIEEGKIQDARRLVLKQYPDVEDVVKIVQLSDSIPNDPFVFRKGVDPVMVKAIVDAFFKYIKTEEGKKNFHALYGVTEFKLATDADYDPVREMLKTLGKSAMGLVKKKK